MNCRVRMFVESVVIHQSIPAEPRPPPRAPARRLPALSIPQVGHLQICSARVTGICQPRGYSKAFDTHAVSYQNIIIQRILLEQQAQYILA